MFGSTAGRVVLGPAAPALRRRTGPVAWCALELLTSLTIDAGRDRVAPVGVRSVAIGLGVAPNTAHRAIRSLEQLGLVVAVTQERAHNGCFAAAGYRVEVPSDALATEAPTAGAIAKPMLPTSRAALPVSVPASSPEFEEVEQLQLLPLA
jgi:hypothetical protein